MPDVSCVVGEICGSKHSKKDMHMVWIEEALDDLDEWDGDK